MNDFSYCRRFPVLAELMDAADRKDVRSIDCAKPMRPFIADMTSYAPGWLRFLYWVRGGFVRLLGYRQDFETDFPKLRPEDLSMTPGDPASFFTVHAAEEDRYWVASATDSTLTGYLAVAAEPLSDSGNEGGGRGLTRYHVLCMAHYLHWRAHIYYNVINPFHHVVVHSMVRAGAR